MRLVLACLAIFLAPAGALFLTVRQVDEIQNEFFQDAKSQIDRLDRVSALYPPNVRRMKAASISTVPDGKLVAGRIVAFRSWRMLRPVSGFTGSPQHRPAARASQLKGMTKHIRQPCDKIAGLATA